MIWLKFVTIILVKPDKKELLTASIKHPGKAIPESRLARFFAEETSAGSLVNIQNKKGMAKPYQVKQVLLAIAKLERTEND